MSVSKLERHEDEWKNGWWGVDPIKGEFCFHCNGTHRLKYMDSYRQGICINCVQAEIDSQRRIKR
ncbi:hypothetical protein J2736_001208 [Paenibacillus qinlingensis]|uniref:Uncharacterized protein n=1 Tax=Paenibacillus qinlingensis TaxID=1837343 RepID=A0ABU1NRE8_9BACL|nr:hypothetical protein [Paenibacillus qinlingensis]